MSPHNEVNEIEEIVQPLLRHWRGGSGSLFIVNHGDEFPEEFQHRVHAALREAGCKVLEASFQELAPNPVIRLVELREHDRADIFSVVVDADRLEEDEGALVKALNLHRSIYAREQLSAIFWIPRSAMPRFAARAANFLDFRTRLVDLEDSSGEIKRDRSAWRDAVAKAQKRFGRGLAPPGAGIVPFLAELVDQKAPQAALQHLDRLRRQTRSGEDLFSIHMALETLAEELGGPADRLIRRLYDHIPAPPERLFTHVQSARDGSVRLWKEIPPGRFLMGSPAGRGDEDEWPQHQVTITRPFRIMTVPVTNAQFAAFDPSRRPTDGSLVEWENLPVTGISPAEAISYCRWLSLQVPSARGARLPTEEEWEYACRAGTSTRYWSGDTEADLAVVGWYDANSAGRPHRVGAKMANPWGLYDMHGNVWEWTASRYEFSAYQGRRDGVEIDSLQIEPNDDPAVLGRVFRGGSFHRGAVAARSACRGGSYRWAPWRLGDLGFRVLIPGAKPSG